MGRATSENFTQLELLGLEGARRAAEAEARGSPARSRRLVKRVEGRHELLSAPPGTDDLAFLHSGLCQTSLPHRRPPTNHTVWQRSAGRFTLMVTPGVLKSGKGRSERTKPGPQQSEAYVGVPYGPKARLIMIYLQSEGLKGRTVFLGKNLSAFLRSLGVPITGGPRGSIGQVKEQTMRIARCSFTLQWDDETQHGSHTVISDTRIVDGLELWNAAADDWSATVELSERFWQHLREHAVPLDRRGIAHLQSNSLGLDLYTLLAYRLPRLSRPLTLTWERLQEQIGSEYSQTRDLARVVRGTMPDVIEAYPHANVDLVRGGLLLKPSKPSVPTTTVQGYKLAASKAPDAL